MLITAVHELSCIGRSTKVKQYLMCKIIYKSDMFEVHS